MSKLFLLFILSTWAGVTLSKEMVAKENLDEAHLYKLDKGIKEAVNKRSLAGEKIKKNKNKPNQDENDEFNSEDFDSEVRYWEYSE